MGIQPLEQRQKLFYDEVAKFANVYPRHILRSFYEHWTEINPGGRKMAFEKARAKGTFEVGKRLGRWYHNYKTDFGRKEKGKEVKRRFPNHYDPLYEKKLSPQESVNYYKHLNINGWTKISIPGQAPIWKEVKFIGK